MSFRSPMDDLEQHLREMIELLEHCDEHYWARRMSMALKGVEANRLGGVSQVLGTFGGEGTMSDLVLLPEREASDPERHLRANRRLGHLRNALFRLADDISNSTARGGY